MYIDPVRSSFDLNLLLSASAASKYPFGVTPLYYREAIAALNWQSSGPWRQLERARSSTTAAAGNTSARNTSDAPRDPHVVYIVHTALEPLRQFDPHAIYVLPLFGARPPDTSAHALTLARAAKRDRVHAVRLPLRE